MAKRRVRKRLKKLQFGAKRRSKRKSQSGGGRKRSRKVRLVRRGKQRSMRGGGAQVVEGRELGVAGLGAPPGSNMKEAIEAGKKGETIPFMLKVMGQTFLDILGQD